MCSNFTGEHPWRSAILIKLQSNFIEIALWHGCSPVNLLHVFRTPYPKNTSTQQTLVLMKTSWRRLENSFLFVFRRRLQDVLINMDIFALVIHLQKTSSRRLGQDQYIRFAHASSRRLQDVFKTSSRRLAKTSLRHLQDVSKTYWRCLQGLFSPRPLEEVYKTCLRDVFNTFLRRTAKTVI